MKKDKAKINSQTLISDNGIICKTDLFSYFTIFFCVLVSIGLVILGVMAIAVG